MGQATPCSTNPLPSRLLHALHHHYCTQYIRPASPEPSRPRTSRSLPCSRHPPADSESDSSSVDGSWDVSAMREGRGSHFVLLPLPPLVDARLKAIDCFGRVPRLPLRSEEQLQLCKRGALRWRPGMVTIFSPANNRLEASQAARGLDVNWNNRVMENLSGGGNMSVTSVRDEHTKRRETRTSTASSTSSRKKQQTHDSPSPVVDPRYPSNVFSVRTSMPSM